MDPRQLFADERLSSFCVYCGGPPDSRDHVPSKVLLDQPYPENLPVVHACVECNNGFSVDEPYVACLIECIICGTTDLDGLGRNKVAKILRRTESLRGLIERCGSIDQDGVQRWYPDEGRVKNVLLKLARGHAAYDCSEPRLDEPESFLAKPLLLMSEEERWNFEAPPEEYIWPEIGSRAFLRAVGVGGTAFLDGGWQVVQPGRYRYLVAHSGLVVRLVLSEYLACEVVW